MTKRNRIVHVRLSEEEYEKVAEQAKKCNMQLVPYIRSLAQNPTIVNVNCRAITAHTREIAEVRKAINRFAFTMQATNTYQPRYMASVINMLNAIFESENQLLKTMRRMRDEEFMEPENEIEDMELE